MKKSVRFILCSVFFLIISGLSSKISSAMVITPFDNATNLAQTIVGPGVTVFNVNYIGTPAASGYFSGGIAAGIGIDSGIVLTSGFASNLDGTANTSDSITGDNGLGGYAPLNALVPGLTTYDATVLEFDFVIDKGDSVYFNYVFGSDEYDEWVGSKYNDVFGFFFNGTAPSDNVALIPGTTTPVAINNVNASSYPQYYNDNDPDIGAPFPFEYDGFTDVFTVSLTGLTPGTPYHLTLAIADASDYIYDSGVFIQGGSFSTTPPAPVPEPSTLLLLGSGLLGLGGLRGVIKRKGGDKR